MDFKAAFWSVAFLDYRHDGRHIKKYNRLQYDVIISEEYVQKHLSTPVTYTQKQHIFCIFWLYFCISS